MFCYKCGTQIPEESGFCHKCGAKLIHADIEKPKLNKTVSTVNPTAATIEETSSVASAVPIQTITQENPLSIDANDFKTFVDNHVRATTKFQSTDDLLNNSKPLMFIWIFMGIFAIVGFILGGPASSLIFSLILGYPIAFIASGIIRFRYRGKFSGEFVRQEATFSATC